MGPTRLLSLEVQSNSCFKVHLMLSLTNICFGVVLLFRRISLRTADWWPVNDHTNSPGHIMVKSVARRKPHHIIFKCEVSQGGPPPAVPLWCIALPSFCEDQSKTPDGCSVIMQIRATVVLENRRQILECRYDGRIKNNMMVWYRIQRKTLGSKYIKIKNSIMQGEFRVVLLQSRMKKNERVV